MSGPGAGCPLSDVDCDRLHMLDAILSASPHRIYVLGRDGRFLYVNPMGAQMLGREPAELVDQPVREAGLEGLAEFLHAQGTLVLAQGQALSGEIELPVSGGLRAYEYDLLPLRTREGTVDAVIANLRDITSRRQAEEDRARLLVAVDRERQFAEALADEADRRAGELAAVFSALTDAIVVYDAQGRPVRANPAAVAVFGFVPLEADREAIIRRLAIRHRDGRPLTLEELPTTRALRGETVRGSRFIMTDRQGRDLVILAAASPLMTDGEVTGCVAVWHDVTEREQLLREVRRRAAELDTIISSIPDGVIVYSPTGEIVRMNAAAQSVLGYTLEMRERPMPTRLTGLRMETPDGRPVPVEESPPMRAVRGEPVTGAVLILHPPTGATVWIASSAAPIRTPEGRTLGAVATFTDITRLHELQASREDILRAVSHDLRNPLAVVQAQAQLLLRALDRGAPPVEARESAQAILTSAQRMNVMIQDLVESARLEVGQLKLNLQPVDLGAFLADLQRRLRGALDVARVRLEVAPGLPTAWADPDRLERILVNLLSNALKYSTPGTLVTVRVVQRERELVIAVTDTGPPIAPEEIPHLFTRYYRAQAGRVRHDSLGLGLYITRMLVEAHGGRVWVESGGGETTFLFTLPAIPS